MIQRNGAKARALRMMSAGPVTLQQFAAVYASKHSAHRRLSEMRCEGLVRTVTMVELTPDGRDAVKTLQGANPQNQDNPNEPRPPE